MPPPPTGSATAPPVPATGPAGLSSQARAFGVLATSGATGLWLVGAYGKTDYTDLHLRDNRVGLSPGSHWKKRG